MNWLQRWFAPLPKALGPRGEHLAQRALRKAGYYILQTNAKLGRYEIDIIAREGDTVAFVEVKTRVELPGHLPEDNITPGKQRRISRAANLYIARNPDDNAYYRFDVVTVTIPKQGPPQITIYRDAFRSNP